MRFFGGKIDIMSTGFSWIHNLLRQIGQGYANVCIGFLVLNGWTHAIVQLEKIYELSLALCSPLNSKGFSVNQETRHVTCCYYVFNTMGKVIHTKYSKHHPYTVAHTIECLCSKINHVLWYNFFLFHWLVMWYIW